MMDQASVVWEEKVASLFQPDILVSAEYFETVHAKACFDPEKRLMLAILEDAVQCFQDNVLARNGTSKNLFDEAEEWILESGDDWIFSFQNICEVFGLNPDYIRQGLIHWKAKKLPPHATANAWEMARAVG